MQTTNAESHDWAEDEDFVAELNERVRRYEEGIDRGIHGVNSNHQLRS